MFRSSESSSPIASTTAVPNPLLLSQPRDETRVIVAPHPKQAVKTKPAVTLPEQPPAVLNATATVQIARTSSPDTAAIFADDDDHTTVQPSKNDSQREEDDEDDRLVTLSIAGPFVQSIITDTPHPMAQLDLVDGDMNDAVRNATITIMRIAATQRRHGSSSSLSTLDTSSPGGRQVGGGAGGGRGGDQPPQSSVSRGGKKMSTINEDDGGGVVDTNNPSEDPISLTHASVETIANQFVQKRFKAAKKSVTEAVQVSFIEMKKRHDGILASVLKHERCRKYIDERHCDVFTKIRENAKTKILEEAKISGEALAKRREEAMAKIKDKEMLKVTEESRAEVDAKEKCRVTDKKEHKEAFALLKKQHNEDIDELCKEHETCVVDLLVTHEKKIVLLKQEIGAKQKLHAHALNSYMSASCSALRQLRGVSPSENSS